MMKGFLFVLFILPLSLAFAQRINRPIKIDQELSEISGLEQFNDSILVAINDSGNQPILYFVNFNGKILKKTRIENAKNNDWEDLALDDQRNLYIGDFGNNLNQRRDLAILKLNIDSAYHQDTISVQFIYFSYENQTSFPPERGMRVFDCESMTYLNGNLLVLTKNTDKKAGESYFYKIPSKPGNYVVGINGKHQSSGKLKDQYTGMDYDEGNLYFLTYKRLTYEQNIFKFRRLTQKEAVLVLKNGDVLVASERNLLLGGPYFHFIDFNRHLSD